MKKTLIAVAAAAALTATSAFAEITFGAWLRVLASPVASTGEDIVAGVENSWGWGARTARININGTSEDGNAGFVMAVHNDFEDGIAQGDDAYLWVKPIDIVKVSVGKFDSPTNGLRGDFCYGSWNWLRPQNWEYDDEGLTFDGVKHAGLLVEADPIEGLHIFANVPLSAKYASAEETYRNAQVGFGYAIEGVGKLKAQWMGEYSYTRKGPETRYHFDAKTGLGKEDDEPVYTGKKDKDATTGTIGVAFDLTAVENLYVTVGARFGIADKDTADGAKYLKMAFTAGASYQLSDAMKFSVSGGYKQYQKKVLADNNDSRFFVGGGVDYALMDGLNLAADVRYMNLGYGKAGKDGAVAFLVGVNKSVSSNGSLGIGFQGATNGCGLVAGDKAGLISGKSYTAGEADGDKDQFVWAIPVSVSVWF